MKAMITVILIGVGLYFSSGFGIGKAVDMSARNSNYQQNVNESSH